jgi:hypothetical protein
MPKAASGVPASPAKASMKNQMNSSVIYMNLSITVAAAITMLESM